MVNELDSNIGVSVFKLLLLHGPLCPGMVAPDRALSMGQIELTPYLC